MNSNRQAERAQTRSTEKISFARAQRSTANEFAHDVWQMVRNRRCRGQKFRCEYPIPPYTADFCCVTLKLVIEINGQPHTIDSGNRHDRSRDRYLIEKGYHVMRIAGYEVLRDAVGVRRRIELMIDERVKELQPSLDSTGKGT